MNAQGILTPPQHVMWEVCGHDGRRTARKSYLANNIALTGSVGLINPESGVVKRRRGRTNQSCPQRGVGRGQGIDIIECKRKCLHNIGIEPFRLFPPRPTFSDYSLKIHNLRDIGPGIIVVVVLNVLCCSSCAHDECWWK